MRDYVLKIPKEQTGPVGTQIPGGAGMVEVRVRDFTGQHVMTLQLAGTKIDYVEGYSANGYEVDVLKLDGPADSVNSLTPLVRGGYNTFEVNALERIVEQFARAMKMTAREIATNAPEDPRMRVSLEGGVRLILQWINSRRLDDARPSREELIDRISFRLACFDDEVYGEKGVTAAREAKFRRQATQLIDELGLGDA